LEQRERVESLDGIITFAMASRTAPLETIAKRFLARREELAEEMTERIRSRVAAEVRDG
jgi:hypothetical protein